jgi:DNA-binding CsgD family transcriptional regulator
MSSFLRRYRHCLAARLQYTIKGFNPKQIAETLFISIYTVRQHIANIYEKLHVNSSAQIMGLAYKNKLG